MLLLIALAALGLPRVILHDLHLIPETGAIPLLLAIVPVLSWIAVALAYRVPNAFVTVLVIGVIFAVMLVTTHQLLWHRAFSAQGVPTVGDGPLAAVIPRLAAIPGGLVTGTLIGVIGGLVAWGIQLIRSRITAAAK